MNEPTPFPAPWDPTANQEDPSWASSPQASDIYVNERKASILFSC